MAFTWIATPRIPMNPYQSPKNCESAVSRAGSVRIRLGKAAVICWSVFWVFNLVLPPIPPAPSARDLLPWLLHSLAMWGSFVSAIACSAGYLWLRIAISRPI